MAEDGASVVGSPRTACFVVDKLSWAWDFRGYWAVFILVVWISNLRILFA